MLNFMAIVYETDKPVFKKVSAGADPGETWDSMTPPAEYILKQ